MPGYFQALDHPKRTVKKMKHVVIVGGGFSGLAAALELLDLGCRVTLLEKENKPGGLAGSFMVGERQLEKFYHHWFSSDTHINDLVARIGRQDQIVARETRTGMYYAHKFFKLSTPLDVLRFKPLSLLNRLRLGYVVLAARRVKRWKDLESLTAKQWLLKNCGEEVYKVVWEPLLIGKFGEFADEVSAVWFWNKLKLRGGSRGQAGREVLAYYKGGFGALAGETVEAIRSKGGAVQFQANVTRLLVKDGKAVGVETEQGAIPADAVLLTVPLPVAADLLEPHLDVDYMAGLRKIRYLSNICIVLELARSLSSIYWLNVNDPSFPFVAIIEHTNFEPTSSYDGRHIVYLSKYLPSTAGLLNASDEEAIEIAIKAVEAMFPEFERKWLLEAHVWRADYSQPIIERHYSTLIPEIRTPIENLFIATMAQVYPEDRGTNYAVRNGFAAARLIGS
jgi:protoporphyrinogen oxidase